MEFLYCEGMSNAQPSTNCFKVKESTVIKKGDIVSIDAQGFLYKSSEGDASVGIAVEDHPANATSDLMPVRHTVKVITSADAVYRAYGIKMQFYNTSTATRLYPMSFDWTNGAYDDTILVLVSKSEESENTDAVGTVRKVSSSYQDEDTYIMNVAAGGIPHPDDVYALLPSVGASDLKQGYTDDFAFETSSSHFRCVGHDLSLNNAKGLPSCYLKLNKHISNKQSNY